MQDILVFCPDTGALVTELLEKYPERLLINDEALENPQFIIDKTPTVRSGAETLALVRADDVVLAMLEALDTVTVLGTYDEVWADPALKAVYDRVYPRTPVTWIDEDGIEQTHTPPEKIGVFA